MPIAFDKLTELLKLAPRYLFALVLVGTLMIILPERAIERLGLRETWAQPRFWVGLILLLAASLLLTHGLSKAWEAFLRYYSGRKNRQRREDKFRNLTAPERKLLRAFVSAGSRSQQLKYDDGVVIGLMHDGMLYYASDRAVTYFDPHFIPRSIWNVGLGNICSNIPSIYREMTQTPRRRHNKALQLTAR
jgi:hypothetical protein